MPELEVTFGFCYPNKHYNEMISLVNNESSRLNSLLILLSFSLPVTSCQNPFTLGSIGQQMPFQKLKKSLQPQIWLFKPNNFHRQNATWTPPSTSRCPSKNSKKSLQPKYNFINRKIFRDRTQIQLCPLTIFPTCYSLKNDLGKEDR